MANIGYLLVKKIRQRNRERNYENINNSEQTLRDSFRMRHVEINPLPTGLGEGTSSAASFPSTASTKPTTTENQASAAAAPATANLVDVDFDVLSNAPYGYETREVVPDSGLYQTRPREAPEPAEQGDSETNKNTRKWWQKRK